MEHSLFHSIQDWLEGCLGASVHRVRTVDDSTPKHVPHYPTVPVKQKQVSEGLAVGGHEPPYSNASVL